MLDKNDHAPRYASAGLANSSKNTSISGKCFDTVFSKKCRRVVLCTDFVSTSFDKGYVEPDGEKK